MTRVRSFAVTPRTDPLADTIAAALHVAATAVRSREEAVTTRRVRRAIARRLDADERDFREALACKYEEQERGDALLADQLMTVLWGSEYGAEA